MHQQISSKNYRRALFRKTERHLLGLWIRLFLTILVLAFFLYQTMVVQNRIAKLRLEIPKLEKELNELEDENTRLQYEIEAFENPLSLIELSRQPEFRGLKHPLSSDILILQVLKSPLSSSPSQQNLP